MMRRPSPSRSRRRFAPPVPGAGAVRQGTWQRRHPRAAPVHEITISQPVGPDLAFGLFRNDDAQAVRVHVFGVPEVHNFGVLFDLRVHREADS